MSFKDYTPILNISTSTIKWSVRVRIQALWLGITRETKEFCGINILMFDESGTRIHAFINAKISKLFEDKLKEGDIYKISKFIVKDYVGDELNRCVRNDKHIYFADFTTLVRDSSEVLPFPEYSFDIRNLVDTQKMESDKRFLCDVVGLVDAKHSRHDYTSDSNESKTQVKFAITDGSCVRKVTLFDKFAEMVDGELNKKPDEPFIVIIACAKVNKYDGELYLTNYPATRFYINVNHYTVKEFGIKSLDPNFNKKPTDCDEVEIIHFKTINQIIQLDENYKGKNVNCRVTLKKVEEQSNWFVYVCLKCDLDLLYTDKKYICPNAKCNRHYPYPDRKFRICALCSDSTGVIAIIFKDSELKKLIGRTVFEVMLDEADDSQKGDLPPCIKYLEGKNYTITLSLKEENVKGGSAVYEACSVFEGFENIGCSKTNIDPEAHSEENTNDTEMDCCVTETFSVKETPKIAQSSKKGKTRKSPQTVSPIDDENAPLAKYKNIKIGKK